MQELNWYKNKYEAIRNGLRGQIIIQSIYGEWATVYQGQATFMPHITHGIV